MCRIGLASQLHFAFLSVSSLAMQWAGIFCESSVLGTLLIRNPMDTEISGFLAPT